MNIPIKLIIDISHIQTGDKSKKPEWRNTMDADASTDGTRGH